MERGCILNKVEGCSGLEAIVPGPAVMVMHDTKMYNPNLQVIEPCIKR